MFTQLDNYQKQLVCSTLLQFFYPWRLGFLSPYQAWTVSFDFWFTHSWDFYKLWNCCDRF